MRFTTILFAVTLIACDGSEPVGMQPDAGTDGVQPGAKRVFLTSARYSGDLKSLIPAAADGVAAADTLCNQAAAAAGLGGTFVAWISSSSSDAISKVNNVGPWYLLSGEKAFNNKANLTTVPLAAIDIDEQGQRVSIGTDSAAWTGTQTGGIRSGNLPAGHCEDWTTNSSALEFGIVGQSYSVAEWTMGDPGAGFDRQGCDRMARLYCFEQ